MTERIGGTEYGLSTADRDTSEWFKEHYESAASQITEFLAGDRISLAGQRVADIGCGDGLIDLGVVHQCRPDAAGRVRRGADRHRLAAGTGEGRGRGRHTA